MTIKQFALHTQQHIESAAATTFKRSHVYELMAAAFGYGTYAALCSEAVFHRRHRPSEPTAYRLPAVATRCRELGYSTTADTIASQFLEALAGERFGVVKIADVISKFGSTDFDSNWDRSAAGEDADSDTSARDPFVDDLDPDTDEPSDVLIESLEAAAGRSNADAHYALALIRRSDTDGDDPPGHDGSYWHKQRLAGAELSAVANEWADEFEREAERSPNAGWHLREAARLGHLEAQLDLADLYADPMFFERERADDEIDDPARAAEIAHQLGWSRDAHRWFTVAAESGDIDSIRTLIETYDHEDLSKCWTWLHFAKLLGKDLTTPNMRAYHDGGPQDGQEYDDDFGGAGYVAGYEGVELPPLTPGEDVIARERADEMYRRLPQRR
jgi:TPR repeat protein